MMTNPVPHPTPIELTYAPESGALSLLDHAVHSAAFALLAANPKIRDEYVKSRDLDRHALAAEAVLRDAKALQGALRRYLDLTIGRCGEPFPLDDDDRPF
jgi:hypothetical protein